MFYDSSISKPKETVIEEYKTRCTSLKEQTNYVEPPKITSKLKLKSTIDSNDIMKEVNQLQDSKYTSSLRRDLMGISANDANSVRKRTKAGVGGGGSGEELTQAMNHHVNMQEKIAEDMLAITRNLREQTETANKIIRKDTDVSTVRNDS